MFSNRGTYKPEQKAWSDALRAQPSLDVMQMKKITIRVVAAMTAVSAIYVLFPNHWRHWFQVLRSLQSGQNPLEGFPPWYLPMSMLFDLVLIGKFIAAIGLFRIRYWGRQIALGVLSFDFLIRLYGAINAWTYPLRHPEPPAVYESEVAVQTVNMIPSHVIAVVSLISILVLANKAMKGTFNEKDA